MTEFQDDVLRSAIDHARNGRTREIEARHVVAALVDHPAVRSLASDLPQSSELLDVPAGVVITRDKHLSDEAEEIVERCSAPDEAARLLPGLLADLGAVGDVGSARQDRRVAPGPGTREPTGAPLEAERTGSTPSETIRVTIRNEARAGGAGVGPHPERFAAQPHPEHRWVKFEWIGPTDGLGPDEMWVKLKERRTRVFRPYSRRCEHTETDVGPFWLMFRSTDRAFQLKVTLVVAPGVRVELEREGHHVEVLEVGAAAQVPEPVIDNELGGIGLPPTASPEQRSAFAQGLAELDALVGLGSVKDRIVELAEAAIGTAQRRRAGLEVPEGTNHMAFMGSPGTGKTVVARIIAKLFFGLGLLDRPITVEVDRSGLAAEHVGQSGPKVQSVVETALGGVLFIDEAYSLTYRQGDKDSYNNEVVTTLLKLMEDHRSDLTVIVAGYSNLMEEFLDSNPGLRNRFTSFVHFDDYTDADLGEIFRRMASAADYDVDENVLEAVTQCFSSTVRTETFGNGRAVRTLFEAAATRQAVRLARLGDESVPTLRRLLIEDVFPDPLTQRGGPSAGALNAVMAELDAMIGLESVKREVADLVGVAQMNQARRRAGLSSEQITRHFVFSGPPGTGKTTVAAHLAQAFRALGILRRGHLTAVTEADLVARYVGQTPSKTTQVVQSALDGVLFIDEAYGLTSGNERDTYGPEALETLLALMEEHRDRLVVIAAGYPDEMESFLDSNPGLRSRFTTTVVFPAYTVEELLAVYEQLAGSKGYTLAEGTIEVVRSHVARAFGSANFGNARGVRSLFEDTLVGLARRLDPASATADELQTLRPEDVPPDPRNPRHQQVGFEVPRGDR